MSGALFYCDSEQLVLLTVESDMFHLPIWHQHLDQFHVPERKRATHFEQCFQKEQVVQLPLLTLHRKPGKVGPSHIPSFCCNLWDTDTGVASLRQVFKLCLIVRRAFFSTRVAHRQTGHAGVWGWIVSQVVHLLVFWVTLVTQLIQRTGLIKVCSIVKMVKWNL